MKGGVPPAGEGPLTVVPARAEGETPLLGSRRERRNIRGGAYLPFFMGKGSAASAPQKSLSVHDKKPPGKDSVLLPGGNRCFSRSFKKLPCSELHEAGHQSFFCHIRTPRRYQRLRPWEYLVCHSR